MFSPEILLLTLAGLLCPTVEKKRLLRLLRWLAAWLLLTPLTWLQKVELRHAKTKLHRLALPLASSRFCPTDSFHSAHHFLFLLAPGSFRSFPRRGG
mmetsp:Transcript_37536/g.60526  ORF Transcript_37536/g.60526 Transcript_37536/m.60526 type:complete len:97 (-) Transcript_37536:47-337(-)